MDPTATRRTRKRSGAFTAPATATTTTVMAKAAKAALVLLMVVGTNSNYRADAFLSTPPTKTIRPSSASFMIYNNRNRNIHRRPRRRTTTTTARSAVEVGNTKQQEESNVSSLAPLPDQHQEQQNEVQFSVGPALQSLQTKLMYKEHTPGSSSSSSSGSSTASTTSPSSLTTTSLSSSVATGDSEKSLDIDDGELSVQQKAINLLFLSAAFGYSIYTILNIDHGMTRGWSATEIAMRIPLDNWGAYESYLANKPIVTKTLINVIIYLLGDWLSQTAFQGKNVLDFDISRTLRNGFIGLCFGPLVHQYYEFSDAILPPENGLVTRLEKILMDQTIYLTIKCSVYISAVGLLAGEDWPTVKQTVEDKIQGVVLTAWKFWPIIHCITYSLIPAQHRILWVNCVDLVWNGLLASMAQKKSSVFEELDDEDENEENLKALSAFEVSSVVIDDIDHSHDSEEALSSNLAAATTTNVDQSTDQLEISKEEKSLKIVNDTMSIDFEEVSNTTATSSIKTANV
eukprot:CAMPEP_0113498460 /NCGR_PEP_ID=MMETSP0014_2-20120614/31190_1 /TAXON_ID=2857 /ORGANISM="Nitzschia sp." /LENGTH=513 /DNA_ID=CAMNT_0000392497 /DNA_START=299 /DNA_END=1840 /DNA_ORIENTATION=+ /assembly_acc=CAM_ASM_000159